MKRVSLGFMLIIWAAALVPAHAASVELAIGGWRQDPNGMLNVLVMDQPNAFDLEDDLDYSPEYRFFGRLKLETPLFFPNIYILAAPMEFDGSGRNNVEFGFSGNSFAADADLDSKLTLNQYDLSLYYSIPGLQAATAKKLNVDLGVNLRWVEFSAEITGNSAAEPGVALTEEESRSILVPMLYAAVQFSPHERFAIEAEARGLAIGDNSMYSILARLRYTLIGPAFIAAGYRYDAIDIDEGDIRVDADFSGPVAEFGLRF